MVLLAFVRWIAIYPVDSVIHLLNTRGQFRALMESGIEFQIDTPILEKTFFSFQVLEKFIEKVTLWFIFLVFKELTPLLKDTKATSISFVEILKTR